MISNEVLDERTAQLRKDLDDHETKDQGKFKDLYDTMTGIKVEMARIGVKVGIAVVVATMVCNAALALWLKGGFHGAPGG